MLSLNKILSHAKPPQKMTVSQWADEYRFLPRESSAESGKWRTDRAPYQRGIMDAISDEDVEMVVVKSSAQIGKTEVVLNCLGYLIAEQPSPVLVVNPTLEMAEAFSKERLGPMLRDCPVLTKLVAKPGAKGSGNTLRQKTFPGGVVSLVGANSPASLASRPIRVVLADELDRFEVIATEGDPFDLAINRTKTFWNRKIIAVSTPTVDGSSRIDTLWKKSDQHRYFVPCPECGAEQTLKWEQVRFCEKMTRPSTYECEHCQHQIPSGKKSQMLAHGRWVATKQSKIRGFHLNELYSPWRSFDDTVQDYLNARDNSDTLRTWTNTALGETYSDATENLNWEDIRDRAGTVTQGIVPRNVAFLTAGVDVQGNRLEMQVCGFSQDKKVYSIDYVVIHGSPREPETWELLREALDKKYDCEDETRPPLPIVHTAVDTGYATHKVYEAVRNLGRNVFAIKGSDSLTQAVGTGKPVDIFTNGKRYKNGVMLWPVGVSHLKFDLMTQLSAPDKIFFPDYEDEFFKQLCAEVIVTELRNGYPKRKLNLTRHRNEALDTIIYGIAAGIKYGLNLFTKDQWRAMLAGKDTRKKKLEIKKKEETEDGVY